MSSGVLVFAGPSLHGLKVDQPGLTLAPPAQCGDILAAARAGNRHILLIDGYFESRLAVWHKEILWVMAQGVVVAGAASMGALRAAELHRFGMIGLGQIFDDYCSGRLTGDDEVAVGHGPAELGYVPTCVALVNVRATLVAALAGRVCEPRTADALLAAARSIFFKDRNWAQVVAKAALAPDVAAALLGWLAHGAVDQKQIDARAALDFSASAAFAHVSAPPLQVPRTCYLDALLKRQAVTA